MGELVEAIFPFFRRFAVETILLTVALAIAVGSVFLNRPADPANTIPTQPAVLGVENKKAMMIDVAGAVKAPGVYEMPGGTRLKDAVTAAGGLADTADVEYYQRNFNQARYLVDQEKVYIPSVQELSAGIFVERKQAVDYLTPQSVPSTVAVPSDSGMVSINTAEAAELENLPGVGQVTAAKIIQLRPYGAIDELLIKQAVKKNVFEQIKNLVSL